MCGHRTGQPCAPSLRRRWFRSPSRTRTFPRSPEYFSRGERALREPAPVPTRVLDRPTRQKDRNPLGNPRPTCPTRLSQRDLDPYRTSGMLEPCVRYGSCSQTCDSPLIPFCWRCSMLVRPVLVAAVSALVVLGVGITPLGLRAAAPGPQNPAQQGAPPQPQSGMPGMMKMH